MAEVPAQPMRDEPTDPASADATSQTSQTTGPTTSSSKAAVRRKFRPTYSCLSCHKRKVKCDRVKPCSACCLRGTPSECEYGTSKQDRHFIHQSTLIENLLHSCRTLKQQLDEARRLANLPPIKDSVVPSPLNLIGAGENTSSAESNPPDSNSPTATVDGTESRRPADTASQRPKSQGSSPEAEVVALVKAVRSDHDRSVREFAFTCADASFPRQVPASGTPFLELWIGRLLDAFSPADHLSGGTLAGLRLAADTRVMSPMLTKAFEAASLTLVGRQDRNMDMEQEGHLRYTNVLNQLQRALRDPEQSKRTDTLVVVLLFMIIEAFKQSSAKAVYRHQLGGLELLRSRTPYRHRYGIERSMFVDLRSYWVSVAIVHRVPSFLASKEWTTVPWSGDGPDKDMFQHLLDIGIQVPAYLAQLDRFTAAVQDPTTLPSILDTLQSTLWQTATELDRQLQTWKTTSADTYPGAPPLERPQVPIAANGHGGNDDDDDDEFPVFRCHNISNLEIVTPTILVYPDLLLAQSMCYYWALRLIISTADTGVVSIISPQERYQAACDICRSMRYYIRTVPGCLATRMMFVLRVAFDTFPDDSVERRFLETVFSYIGSRLRLTTFINHCVDSSLKIESAD